jgi:tRNA-2-methylthio-N6-dimethylallyladenosine synthase
LTQNNNDSKTIAQDLKNELESKSFFIKTYGCQMNVNDSSSAKALFEQLGMREVHEEMSADIIMISTCCVREKAELKIYSYIGSLRAIKEENKDLIIIISGCMSEQSGVKSAIFSRFPFVDIVIGTGMIPRLPDYLLKRIQTERRVNYELDDTGEYEIPLRSAERVSEFVTIMKGCDNFCSYCIVPYVRGRECSRDAEEIISEINKFAQNGCREITLLGQNVNSYGLDKPEGINFAGLLQKVANETPIDRIRFMTSHPKDLTDEVLEFMAGEQKMCRHIHLPLQSGSDSILKKMNRKYDTERYMHIIEYARKLMPDIEFTTDIIVGFPGETEQDFEHTLNMMRKVRYASAFMFKYSKRSGTPAAKFLDQVDTKIKKQRLTELMNIEAEIKKEIYTSYIGTVQEILVEDKSYQTDTFTGKTSSAVTVNFKGTSDDIGKLIKVKITKAKTNTLYAEKIEVN